MNQYTKEKPGDNRIDDAPYNSFFQNNDAGKKGVKNNYKDHHRNGKLSDPFLICMEEQGVYGGEDVKILQHTEGDTDQQRDGQKHSQASIIIF